MLRAAPTTAAHVKSTASACRAVVAPRRVAMRASSPSNNGKDAEHHSLISVWEDKELADNEAVTLKVPSPPAGEQHSLVSVWEEHELAEEEKAAKAAKENSLLNHPTGKQQAASSYDSM